MDAINLGGREEQATKNRSTRCSKLELCASEMVGNFGVHYGLVGRWKRNEIDRKKWSRDYARSC